jgi:SET domain-containing protein
MTRLSYLSPKTAVRTSAIQGRGLFAAEPIVKGEIVAVKGGHIVGRGEIPELRQRLGPAEIQIAEYLYIAPVSDEEREGSMIFSNHSCEPNIGVSGQVVFVAMRDIAAGEELTHDWAMTDDDSETMACRCGTPSCRGNVSGKDWMCAELHSKYAGYFSAYLAEKIRRLEVATASPDV